MTATGSGKGLPATELLPCPFCGSASVRVAVAYHTMPQEPTQCIVCDSCGCRTTDRLSHAKEAIDIWNRRASSPRPSTTDDEVERVARAICANVPGTGNVDEHFTPPDRNAAQMWKAMARAAIAAIAAMPASPQIDALIKAAQKQEGTPVKTRWPTTREVQVLFETEEGADAFIAALTPFTRRHEEEKPT